MTQVIVKPATAANVKRLVQAALEHELRILNRDRKNDTKIAEIGTELWS